MRRVTAEFSMIQDWEEHDYRPRLAEQMWIEDLLILEPEFAAAYGDDAVDAIVRDYEAGPDDEQQRRVKAIYGEVEETPEGYKVTPLSPDSAQRAAARRRNEGISGRHRRRLVGQAIRRTRSRPLVGQVGRTPGEGRRVERL